MTSTILGAKLTGPIVEDKQEFGDGVCMAIGYSNPKQI